MPVSREGTDAAAISDRARFFDLALDLFVISSRDGTILQVNSAAERLLGYSPGEMVGRSWMEFVHPEDIHRTLRDHPTTDAPVFQFTNRWVGKDGSIRLLAWTGATDQDEGRFYATARDITRIRQTADRLHAYHARLHALVQAAPVALWAIDHDGRFTLAEGTIETEGRAPSEYVGESIYDLYGDVPEVIDVHERTLAGESPTLTLDLDGRTWKASYTPLRGPTGRIEGAIGVAVDVTEHRDAERRVRESDLKYREIVETSRDLIWALDAEGRVTFVNQAARRTHGYEPEEALGRPFTDFVAPENRADALALFKESLAGGAVFDWETEHVHKDGSRVLLSFNTIPHRDASGQVTGVTGTATDVSDRARHERELRELAEHDPLTGLFNRHRFEHELDREAEAHARYGREGAVIVLDLDNFKYVNDTRGHAVGDELLTAVAAVLGERLRPTDVAARIGGDEFAAVLPATDLEAAGAIAEDLRAAIHSQVMPTHGRSVRVSASVGMATIDPAEVCDARELLRRADLAMYEAKDAGRDRVARFSAAGEARMSASAAWAERIRDALEHDHFVLEAQPILDLSNGDVSQHELLLRMDRDGELVPPAEFLTIAERFGLMGAVDRWVLGNAIERVARQAGGGFEVNLSARSLGDPQLLEFIEARIADCGADPATLVFEITETEAIAHMDDARRFARRLTDLGCRFALDDFGTGFGSFHYLKHLPLDFLKIDGDFIRDLARNPDDRLIVRAVVDVAQGLGLRTIAEWVQDRATLTLVGELGVDYAQGYFIGRPGPLP